MYEAADDPYCYPGTTVLINKLDLRDSDRLKAFEEEIVRERAAEQLPSGRLTVTHFCSVHRHLFQDVYDWAGRLRTVRIVRGGSMFCYPEHIRPELRRLFGWLRINNGLRDLETTGFSTAAAHFLAELNAIHAFRDGNGRTQLVFLDLLAARAGHPLDFDRLDPEVFLTAMIASFGGDEAPLVSQIRELAR